jgi:hypothetical protein
MQHGRMEAIPSITPQQEPKMALFMRIAIEWYESLTFIAWVEDKNVNSRRVHLIALKQHRISLQVHLRLIRKDRVACAQCR